jgi:hypothetical protein
MADYVRFFALVFWHVVCTTAQALLSRFQTTRR